jgi:hypothetical protein
MRLGGEECLPEPELWRRHRAWRRTMREMGVCRAKEMQWIEDTWGRWEEIK